MSQQPLESPEAREWLDLGFEHWGAGNLEEALASFNNALELSSFSDHQAWYGRGIVLSALGRHKEAFDSYDCALELEPSS